MKKKRVPSIPKQLLAEINNSLVAIESHGSVEIFVTDRRVTQITVRNIKKTGQFLMSGGGNGVKKALDKPISID